MSKNRIGTYYIDVVMCIDVSGGMIPFVYELKYNIESFYNKFVEAMDDRGACFDQLRVKFICFRDYGWDDEPILETPFFVLPDQHKQLNEFVKTIEAKGGGDCPENALEAIALALKSNWTVDGTKKRYVVAVFSDAPAVPLGERSQSSKYPADMPKDLAQLHEWWEGTDQTLGGTYKSRFGRLVAFVPNADPWYDLETWNMCLPTFVPTCSGLSSVDFQSVVDVIVESFSM